MSKMMKVRLPAYVFLTPLELASWDHNRQIEKITRQEFIRRAIIKKMVRTTKGKKPPNTYKEYLSKDLDLRDIAAYLRRRNAWVTKSDLAKMFRAIPAKRRDQIMDDLVNIFGIVIMRKTQTKGRPVVEYKTKTPPT